MSGKNIVGKQKVGKKRKVRKLGWPKQSEPQNSSASGGKRIYWLIYLLVSLSVFYFIFYSPFFKIRKNIFVETKTINHDNAEKVINDTLVKRRFLIIPGDNIFFCNTKLISQELKKHFTQIDSLAITKKYPSILRIEVKERKVIAIWMIKEGSYYLDEEGKICCQVNPEEELILPKMVDSSDSKVEIGNEVVSQKHIKFIRGLNDRFVSKVGFGIASITIPLPQADEVHVLTDRGFDVYFNVEKDVDEQLDNLRLVLDKTIKDKKVDYIDLRVENWVYYK